MLPKNSVVCYTKLVKNNSFNLKNMKKNNFLISGLALLLVLVFVPVANAQTTTVDETVVIDTTSTDVSSTEQVTVTENLDSVEVTPVDKVPSTFGLFWLGLKERVNIALTFDPVKKAEKQVAYAEQRMKIAEKIAENSDDPQVQEKVQKMVDRAQELISKVQDKKDKFLDNKNDNVQRLLKNVAIHTENKEALLDKIETKLQDKLTPEQLDKFQAMREDGVVKAQGILQALSNPNMPEEIKVKLQEVKDRIDAKSTEVQKFREEQKQVLEDVKNGVEGAKEELKNLFDSRKEEIKVDLEDIKARLENRREVEQQLREDAQSGDVEARQKLERMKKVDGQIKENVQDRIENRQEVRQNMESNNTSSSIQLQPKSKLAPLPVQKMNEIKNEVRRELQKKTEENKQEKKLEIEDKIEIEDTVEVESQN